MAQIGNLQERDRGAGQGARTDEFEHGALLHHVHGRGGIAKSGPRTIGSDTGTDTGTGIIEPGPGSPTCWCRTRPPSRRNGHEGGRVFAAEHHHEEYAVPPVIVGRTGPFTGQSMVLDGASLSFGRKSDNGIVIVSASASRLHAEIVTEDAAHVLYDRDSRNGTHVNGQRVTRHVLRPNDCIRIGDETFLYEAQDAMETVMDLSLLDAPRVTSVAPGTLQVTVSGGGPVGLAFALALEEQLRDRVAVTVHDGRWAREGSSVVWKDEKLGNVRRQQVVTVQSRQYMTLPDHVREALFDAGGYSEMWPV
ncbi:FHA domain-containing protein [Streptomyces phaeochromogenes]|uniref:FHA domain-containing protein n=1 Tax=Streptomyces phaeochromogenes TaxID=1923 RepID=UPI003405C0FD